jgi:hypothetical protein
LVFVRKRIKHGEGALSADEFKVSCWPAHFIADPPSPSRWYSPIDLPVVWPSVLIWSFLLMVGLNVPPIYLCGWILPCPLWIFSLPGMSSKNGQIYVYFTSDIVISAWNWWDLSLVLNQPK